MGKELRSEKMEEREKNGKGGKRMMEERYGGKGVEEGVDGGR